MGGAHAMRGRYSALPDRHSRQRYGRRAMYRSIRCLSYSYPATCRCCTAALKQAQHWPAG